MSAYDEINETMNDYQKNVANDENLTKEEKTKIFFEMATKLFNDHISGDITLADGRIVHIPEI